MPFLDQHQKRFDNSYIDHLNIDTHALTVNEATEGALAMQGAGSEDIPTERDLRRILKVARQKALSLGANRHEADEVAQVTVIRLYQKWNTRSVRIARSRSEERWEAYIRRVARNSQWDLVRSHQRRLAREDKALGIDIPRVNRNGGTFSPASSAGSDSYLARAAIVAIILKLPPKQQAIAIRMCIMEMSVNETAEQVGLQAQSVRKHMRAIRGTIKQALEEENTDRSTGG